MSGETSFPWGGRTVGDANYKLSDFTFGLYFAALARRGFSLHYGILYTTNASYSGLLAPTNPAGTTFRMASGAAVNLYWLYLNNANIDFSCATKGYYRLVIRVIYNDATVRAVLLGPSTGGWPSFRRGNEINDVLVARIYSTGAALTIYDDRRFFRNIVMPVHSGEALLWDQPSAVDARVRGTLVQCGAFVPQTTPSVDFPRRYPVTTSPIVIMGASGDNTVVSTRLVNENNNGTDAFDYYISSETGIDSIYFLSFGMRR